jgi:hypothetical protein
MYTKILVGKAKGKKPLGRPGHRWKDYIKRDHKETGFDDDWICLAQDSMQWWILMNMVITGGEFLDQLSMYQFPRKTLLHGVSKVVLCAGFTSVVTELFLYLR